ncbi:hypothetical protein ACJJTC_015881 [Scirpophaga incertulas]
MMYFKRFVVCVVICELQLGESMKRTSSYNSLIDHSVVQDSTKFPYIVAVLKKSSYLSAGALLNEKWVLTAADSLYTIRESSRVLRVRLGSNNYKKGGILLPVKRIIVHPKFDDSRPSFDLALLCLAKQVRLTPNLYPIKMQRYLRNVTASHFQVVNWTPNLRNTGAPVVLNGFLWGIISSWRPDNCKIKRGNNFVNLVAGNKTSSWIYSTFLHEENWSRINELEIIEDHYDEDESSDTY